MRHHVLLVSLDALRADRVGCCGGTAGLTPRLDEIARESVVFRDASSPATWTLPAHISLLSGLEPPVHGCLSGRHRYPPETLPFPLLFELLAEVGHAPLAVTGGGYMAPEFGFGRGAPRYLQITPLPEATEALLDHLAAHERCFALWHTFLVHDYPRLEAHPFALERARRRDPDYRGLFPTDRDFHGLIAALTVGGEPGPGERDLAFVRDVYDATVQSLDYSIGLLVDGLRARGLWDATTLVLTADHGESLGELHDGRRSFGHNGAPYREQAQVPLLIRPAPALREVLPPGVVEEAVSLIDVAPTLLELCGVPCDRERMDGRSLVELRAGQVAAFETRRLVLHSCEEPGDRYLDPRLLGTGLRWGELKVIYDHRRRCVREVYRLDRDPAEVQNRLGDVPPAELRRVEAALEAERDRAARRAHRPPALPIEEPGLVDRLKQLGYLE